MTDPSRKDEDVVTMRAKLLVGLSGAAVLLLRKVFSPRTARPVPAPAVADAPPPADAAGASPGEALADDATRPHVSTTPSHPVEVVEVDPEA